jgi:4-hydroxy-2-oxoheptanedioate aldolase
VPDFYHKANDETLLVVLIEDIVAWGNLDDIISVEGIDVFFVAPGDFAASMGHILDPQHPEVQEKIDDALSRIVAAGHSAGTLATNDTVERYAALGVRFFFTVSQPWLNAGAREFMAQGEAGRARSR